MTILSYEVSLCILGSFVTVFVTRKVTRLCGTLCYDILWCNLQLMKGHVVFIFLGVFIDL